MMYISLYIEVYYRILTPALFRDILIANIKLSAILLVDMHDTSQVGSRNFLFLRNNHKRTYGKFLGFNTDWKGFKQYLIVGRYLGVALSCWISFWYAETHWQRLIKWQIREGGFWKNMVLQTAGSIHYLDSNLTNFSNSWLANVWKSITNKKNFV